MAGASQVTSSNPWATATPYLTDILGRAQSLYGQQAPLYANPAGNFGFGQATGAVGSALGGNTTLGGMANQLSPIASGNISSQFANPFGTTGNLDATSAIRQQLSGTPDYSAVNGALDAANTQQWNQFYNQVVPQLNQRASFLGNPSGAIKDLNSAITNIGQNQSLNAQQAYLGQYNLAQQRQQGASSLVANGGLQSQSNALGLGGLAGNLAQGTGTQSLTAAQLFPGISMLPQQNLSDYASIVGNAAGRYGTNTQNINPGSGQTIANVLGGLTAGAGLYNTLFPQNGGGAGSALLGGLGKLFGGLGGGYSSLNNWMNNGDSTSIIDQYNASGGAGISGNTPTFSQFDDPTLQNVGYPDPSQWDTGNINWGDGNTGFNSAGGQAANQSEDGMTASNFQTTGTTPAFDAYQATAPSTSMGSMTGASALGTVGTGLGIAKGLASGSPVGYASAGLGAAKLAANNNAFGTNSGAVGGGVGAASNALGIYSGIQQGGVSGDTSAAVNAAQLGSRLGVLPGAVGAAAGYVAAPLAVYNFAKNYESGATGSDAMNGATAGATIGGVGFGPVGAVAGGAIGGAVGALASAFGPGAKDPETVGAQKLLDATSSNGNNPAVAASVTNPYLMLQGLMDQHSSDLPLFQKYGRANAMGFTKDMTTQINSALRSGQISKSDTPDTVYQKVVQPWINSMGDWNKVGSTYKSTVSGLLQNMTAQFMGGQEYKNWNAVNGGNPFLSLTPFGGTAVAMPVTASSSPGRTGGVTRRN